jgi:S-formylglutathione hydrolase FrmB
LVSPGLTGRWRELSYESDALRDNPLGDPHVRPVYVWAPEGDGPYPVVYVLQGFTGMAPGWFNVRAWHTPFPEQVERLEPKAIVVLVDAFTAIGGSQFVDSPAVGQYHTYLCEELVPWIDGQFPTGRRGVQGHSSGGYGAMVNAMLRPDLFSGFATHAGDALFENCYEHEFTDVVRALRDSYDGSFDRFWDDFRTENRPQTKKSDHALLNIYAMAAAYSGGELPFDIETGELRDEVWRRWLDWDPVRMARKPQFAEALRGMQAIWIEAGKRDEFNLELGAVAFHRAVLDTGVDADVVHYELHGGGHFDTPRVTAAGLTWLAERLA